MRLLYLHSLLLTLCTLRVECIAIKEERYEVAPGVEGYHLSIPVNHPELEDFLNGKKTQMLQEYESHHGFDRDTNPFGNMGNDIKKGKYDFLDVKPRPFVKRQTYQNDTEIFKPWNTTQYEMALDSGHAIVKKQTPQQTYDNGSVNILYLDEVVECQPYKRLYAAAVLSNDHDANFEPACLEVALCDGCCGYRTCAPRKQNRVGYYYHKWQTSPDSITPELIVHTFQFNTHETCAFECKEKETDCSSKQLYDAGKCKCKCPIIEQCSYKHEWDDKECACVCKHHVRCGHSAVRYFSIVDCNCHYHHNFHKDIPSSTILPKWPIGGPNNPITPPFDPADVIAGRIDLPYDDYHD